MKRLGIVAVGLALVVVASACGDAEKGVAVQPTAGSSFKCGGSQDAEYLATALLAVLDLHGAGQGLQGFSVSVPSDAPAWDGLFDDYRETIEGSTDFRNVSAPDSLSDFKMHLGWALAAAQNAYSGWDAALPYPDERDLGNVTELFFQSASQFRSAADLLNSTCWGQ